MSDASKVACDALAFAIPFAELGQTVETVLDALGYDHDAPQPVVEFLELLFPDLPALIDARGGYRIVAPALPDPRAGRITCPEATFAVDHIIAGQLRTCDALALFAATAGGGIGARSAQLAASDDMLAAYIADVVGSEAAEAAARIVEQRIDTAAATHGYGATERYSPGYCGWNVAEQRILFGMLPPAFCGITLTDGALMLPVKSVSGVVGIGPGVRKQGYACAACDDEHCLHRQFARYVEAR